MIVLDTNVMSAMMTLDSEPEVLHWLRHQNPRELAVPAPTLFEIRFGIEIKPAGRRRRSLEAALGEVLALLDNRILPFDGRAAALAAQVRARQKKVGRTVEIPDSLIAGVALSFDAAIATRNVAHYQQTALVVINPWHGR